MLQIRFNGSDCRILVVGAPYFVAQICFESYWRVAVGCSTNLPLDNMCVFQAVSATFCRNSPPLPRAAATYDTLPIALLIAPVATGTVAEALMVRLARLFGSAQFTR